VIVHGACHCGAIAYEAEVDPARATICHCIDCQKLSGAAFRASVPARVEDFRLLRGTPKAYVKIAESGNRRAQVFCADCGSPLYSADAAGAKAYMLRIGAMAERAHLPPQREIWYESALPWTRELLPLPKVEKQS
jgi:hypothetical protein